MDQPPKLRIRNPNVVTKLEVKPTPPKKLWKNEDFVFGVIVGVLSLIVVELCLLMLYGFVGALTSMLK